MKHLQFIQFLHDKLRVNGLNPTIWEIRSLDWCDSTNNQVKRLLNFYENVVVLSKIQSSGKGRENRIWYSPEGGIWLSIGTRMKLEIVELSTPIIEQIATRLREYVNVVVKEPNDLLINDKKLAGVLVETQIKGQVLESTIVGLGMNVENEIPLEVKETATRLVDHYEVPDLYLLASEIALDLINTIYTYQLST